MLYSAKGGTVDHQNNIYISDYGIWKVFRIVFRHRRDVSDIKIHIVRPRKTYGNPWKA